MDQIYTNNKIVYYYKDLDENLAWVTQNSKKLKDNEGNFMFNTHSVTVIEL